MVPGTIGSMRNQKPRSFLGTDAVSAASLASLRLALLQLAAVQLAVLRLASVSDNDRSEKKKSNWSNMDVQS